MLLAEAARYADGNWKRKCHECLRPGLGREPVLEGLEGLQDVPQTPPAVDQIAAVGKPAASLDGRSKRTPSTRNCGAPDQIGVCYSSVGSRHSVVTPTSLSLVSTEEALLVIFRTAVIGLVACIIISGASPAAGNDERSGCPLVAQVYESRTKFTDGMRDLCASISRIRRGAGQDARPETVHLPAQRPNRWSISRSRPEVPSRKA